YYRCIQKITDLFLFHVRDVSRDSITISQSQVYHVKPWSWKFPKIRKYISACQEPSEQVLNVMIR
ncbi:unnamed protein product, partial [Bubo scandiacus]